MVSKHVLESMTWQEIGFDSKTDRDAYFGRLNGHFALAEDFFGVLYVIFYWTEKLSAASSVTISFIPRAVDAILKATAPDPARTDQGHIDFFDVVHQSYIDRFEDQLHGHGKRPVRVAQFLDPRTTFEIQESDAVKRQAWLDAMVTSLEEDFSFPAVLAGVPDADMLSHRSISRRIKRCKEQLQDEVERHYDHFSIPANAMDENKDPISDYWLLPSTLEVTPILAQLACAFLSVQASEAESERAASMAGLLLTARRRKMGGPLAQCALVAHAAAMDLRPRAPRKAYVGRRHQLDNALHIMKYGVPLPAAAAPAGTGAGAGIPAPVAINVDSDDEDDLGDIQNDMLDAGIVPDADGALPLSKIIDVLDDAEELQDEDLEVLEAQVIDLGDDDPASAAAQPPVRRSARQSARQQAAIKRLAGRLNL
jgi:hypothetical protein